MALPGWDAKRTLERLQKQCRDAHTAGDFFQSERLARRILALDPNDLNARVRLAQASMPGLRYREVLAEVHRQVQPATYLEIGLDVGISMGVAESSRIVGIDPNAAALRIPARAGMQIFAMTSDDFFARHDLTEALGGPLDFAFIDGMHLFEYALRDFINTEKHCHSKSVVAFHDTLPPDPLVAHRERITKFWTGDVWKIAPCLRKYRPDLRVVPVRAAPSGFALVTGLDPSNRALEENLASIYEEFGTLPFPDQKELAASSVDASPDGIAAALRR